MLSKEYSDNVNSISKYTLQILPCVTQIYTQPIPLHNPESSFFNILALGNQLTVFSKIVCSQLYRAAGK